MHTKSFITSSCHPKAQGSLEENVYKKLGVHVHVQPFVELTRLNCSFLLLPKMIRPLRFCVDIVPTWFSL